MATRRNIKSRKSRKLKKNYKRIRRGGTNECERLPFSRLSYEELYNNYKKYCSSVLDKTVKNKPCCNLLKAKFKNWTTDGRDFDTVTEQNDFDEQYNTINSILPEDDSFSQETFIRTSKGGKTKKKNRKYRK